MLCCKTGSRCLCMSYQHQRLRFFCTKPLAHNICPHPSCRTELLNLFQKIVMYIKEEGKLRSKIINVKTAFNTFLDISDSVGKSKSQLLNGSRACLANMIARY